MSTLRLLVKACTSAKVCPETFCLLGALVLTGCKSGEFSSYVSPRVTGRVVAADTLQPLADVKIRRVDPDAIPNVDEATKGGQLMERTAAVTTDEHGNFVMDAERDLTLLSRSSWYSVTLSFKHEGYLPLTTNYTIVNVTSHTGDGAPVVNAGQIGMRPLAR